MPRVAAYIEIGRHLVDQILILIDNGNIVLFTRETPRDAVSDPASPADKNAHSSAFHRH
jgi:hypothetical protein